MIQAAKIIGTALATTDLIGAKVCIGVVFGALILGVARNPSQRGQLFLYAILGFAFAEAIGLFALMMAFLSLTKYSLISDEILLLTKYILLNDLDIFSLNLISSFGSIVSVIATWLFLYIVYAQLVEGRAVSRYPWMTPQFYVDSLQSLLSRAYNSLEWALNSPPKPHAFQSLPLQNGVLNNVSISTGIFSSYMIYYIIIATITGMHFLPEGSGGIGTGTDNSSDDTPSIDALIVIISGAIQDIENIIGGFSDVALEDIDVTAVRESIRPIIGRLELLQPNFNSNTDAAGLLTDAIGQLRLFVYLEYPNLTPLEVSDLISNNSEMANLHAYAAGNALHILSEMLLILEPVSSSSSSSSSSSVGL